MVVGALIKRPEQRFGLLFNSNMPNFFISFPF